MTSKFYFIILLCIGSLIYSCKSSAIEYQSTFETSQKAWLEFKESTDNSYQYTVSKNFWTGSRWETQITVENGIITERNFKYTSTRGLSDDFPKNKHKWVETKKEIGTHENGAEALTLDEIYRRAEHAWLIERENAKTYFMTENNGLISTCGYVENRCADDCFRGVTIDHIESL
ncbi:MAG: hypothetical protein L0J45_06805 [Psychroflexus sp.]|nr:hypothetical protein [Psychroflexus sp.]MDN6309652.1 hypothetical protein [Psychroflexus sp.]